jgi:hypothetical protein
MTAPKRGMVAGQPITTGAQTKEYDEGFERTFGERKPTRGRFVYTQGGTPLPAPIEIGADFVNPGSERVPVTSDLYMDGVAATDGVDIGSRKKRREYMKINNLADADDFKGEWAKAQSERESFRSGTQRDPERRESIARALYTQGKRR